MDPARFSFPRCDPPGLSSDGGGVHGFGPDETRAGPIPCLRAGDSPGCDIGCDGTGGYLRAEGKGVMEIERSHLIPDLVATEDATVLLRDCVVDGSIRASGRARVRLVSTKVGGAIERFDGAVIERR